MEAYSKRQRLKEYLEELGVEYEARDALKYIPHLDAVDGIPFDGGMPPTLEVLDPDSYEDPICYTHDVLFSSGKLREGYIATIVGKADGYACI